ncbi:MAG TPA: hypothetical protein VFR14_00770 [Candidatus Limnocylindrales bacterium]|nr:hypothetical protein [Candidatus Limnocylindrales bacterium]
MARPRPIPPASTFLRGLTVGALVGAAIAGSLLVGRRRRVATTASKPPTPMPASAPAEHAG